MVVVYYKVYCYIHHKGSAVLVIVTDIITGVPTTRPTSWVITGVLPTGS